MKQTLRFATLGLLAAVLLGTSTGCIVIPVGDLFKGPPLVEMRLEEGAGVFEKEKIAIVDIAGVITGNEQSSVLTSSPNTVSEVKTRLDWAASDPEVKAIVLRISSPGGEVTACDILYREVKRLREQIKIPVVACIQDTGASGGYYIAAASDHIMAHPTAIVGSIGVILHSFDLSQLLEKLGVKTEPVKSSDMKDLLSFFRPRTETETQVLKDLVSDMYERFVDAVDEGRPDLTREKILELADGRVVSGLRAAKSGLVDEVGFLDDAIRTAAELAQVDSPTVVRYTRRPQGGSNIYTKASAPSVAAGTEVTLRIAPESLIPRPQMYFLWTP